jgi:hypothetical protein
MSGTTTMTMNVDNCNDSSTSKKLDHFMKNKIFVVFIQCSSFFEHGVKMNLSVVEEVVHVEDAFHHGTTNLEEKEFKF